MQYSLCSVIYIVKKSMSRLFSVSLIDSSILLRCDASTAQTLFRKWLSKENYRSEHI